MKVIRAEHGWHGRLLPAPILTSELEARAMREISTDARAMADPAPPFQVTLRRANVTAGGPKLIAYNVRFAIPMRAIMPRIEAISLPASCRCNRRRLCARRFRRRRNGVVLAAELSGQPQGGHNR